MSRFRTTREVAHSPTLMFDLVADVERYPEFVPLCEGLKVIRRQPTDAGETIAADMTVGYKALRETFRSTVVLDRAGMRIEVHGRDGPFARLDNIWTFAGTMNGGCRIVFDLDYRFRSRGLQLMMGAMFDKAFSKFAKAFEERADRVYGQPVAGA